MSEEAAIERADLTETKIDVAYCIDLDTRDIQLRSALARGLPAIREFATTRGETVCIVAFGPSLRDTWQEVRNYKHIFTCSGSHKFLLDHGVKPEEFQSWTHVECDPRKHKLQLIGQPQHKIRYLLSSVTHPDILDALKDYSVILWHIYDGTRLRDMPCIYPPGEVIITGGSNVGLRSLVLARVDGFRNMHIIGMDYSFPKSDDGVLQQHAADHPKVNKRVIVTEVGGKEFQTTPVMLHYAREFWHEVNCLADCRFTLSGDGLLQEWAKSRKQDLIEADAPQVGIAMKLPYLISDAYKALNRKLHEDRADYGCRGHNYADVVARIRKASECDSVLDYGCGKGRLARALPFPIWEYDPAIPGKDHPPRPADLVMCTDVLEHIEPEYIDEVIADLARATKKVVFIVISMATAQKVLPDGRNTHLIVEKKEWWLEKLGKWFTVPTNGVKENGTALQVVAAPKPITGKDTLQYAAR